MDTKQNIPSEPPPPYYGPGYPPPSSGGAMPPPPPGFVPPGGGGGVFVSAHHPPPPGGVPVFPGMTHQGDMATIVVGAPVTTQPGVQEVRVISLAKWDANPMMVHCPNCQAQVLTATRATPGLLTYLLAGTLIVLGCWAGCCLIPCCIPECQNVEHTCPNCKVVIGTYQRL